MMSQEDNLVLLSEFLEKGDCRVLVVYANHMVYVCTSSSTPRAGHAQQEGRLYSLSVSPFVQCFQQRDVIFTLPSMAQPLHFSLFKYDIQAV